MHRSKYIVGAALLAAALSLSGCDSAEERAAEHYKSAVSLMEAGDVDRALVEFRNVLSLNEGHREAREAYAQILRDRGRLRDAFSQYLYIAEQYPTELEPRLALAEIAFAANSWQDAGRHVERALEVAPENGAAKAFAAALRYRQATLDEDEPARREAAREVEELSGFMPDGKIARNIRIDSLLRDGEFPAALTEIEAALSDEPENKDLHRQQLMLLNRLGEEERVQESLEALVVRFPEDEAFRSTLVEWYVSRGNIDEAENFLRARAAAAGPGDIATHLNLALFLRQNRGIEAARTQLQGLVASGRSEPVFRSLLATLKFDAGDREEAIADLEAILGGVEIRDEFLGMKMSLAKMQFAVGNQVAGRQQVEEVLEQDSSNIEALKLKAGWLIEDDRSDEAVVALRTALDQDPRDPQIMSLMADAHIRNGSRGLARDMLALAAEASNNAPAHALKYARLLIADDNLSTAEGALVDSLRVVPGNVLVLQELGRIYLRQQDWARAEQVEGTLRRLETDEGRAASRALQVLRLQRQDRGEEAIALLDALSRQADSGDAAEIAIVRSYIRSGDFDQAENFIDEALENDPDRETMRYMRAALFVVTERYEEAEVVYRALLADNPQNQTAWRTFYTSLRRQGRLEEASAVLQEALSYNPEARDLLWARAGELEAAGDIDGAIEIYEELYEKNSRSFVIANNLASLITTYRETEEDLQRAYRIARRLRGTEIPQFQDTYGWIAYRRGLVDEALDYLAPAAEALGGDPMVQYHYAMALAAAEENEQALEQFRSAVDIAGPADTRPQFSTARDEIKRLEALLAE